MRLLATLGMAVICARASDLAVGQTVLLHVPSGWNHWLLSETCSNAELLFQTASRVREGAWKFTYAPGTPAVIRDLFEDGTCAYVQSTQVAEAEGWVDVRLVELTPEGKRRWAAARKLAEEKRRARQEYLASLPRLRGVPEVVPIAVDDGCYADLLKATRLQGLELRKRMGELAAFGCLFLARGGTRVEATKRPDGNFRVVIQEGPQLGKTGIVAPGFLTGLN